MDTYGFFCNGKWCRSENKIELKNPFNGHIIAEVDRPSENDLDNAIAQSVEAFQKTRKSSSHDRYEILRKTSESIAENHESLARILSLEAGKPLKEARVEVSRAVQTFRLAAEESKRIYGELIPTDLIPANKNRWVITRRFPVGPVAGISPFNFPLNLVAHKVAPAIAAGNTITLKPASQTPLSALRLAEIVHEAGAMPGTFNVIPCSASIAENLVTDDRIKMVTFTGSPDVGWSLKNKAGKKKVTLELGGNAAVIVHDDAQIDYAVNRITVGAFAYAGQICISVQRILLHEDIADSFMELFLKEVENLKVGDPINEETNVGPLISNAETERVVSWIHEAVKSGAKVLTGGDRCGNCVKPAVLADVPKTAKISCREAFGPVVTVEKYSGFDNAINIVNDSIYGLQAGVFTRDFQRVWNAFEDIETGGVVINDIPTFRADEMPYGGVKNSGFGREGLRYAIEEMTEIKALALNMNI